VTSAAAKEGEAAKEVEAAKDGCATLTTLLLLLLCYSYRYCFPAIITALLLLLLLLVGLTQLLRAIARCCPSRYHTAYPFRSTQDVHTSCPPEGQTAQAAGL
jgi:hypothetical protein